MSQTLLPRESVEYLEILSEVFADIVRRATSGREAGGSGEVTHSLAQCLQYVYLHGPSSIRKVAAGLSITVPAASQLVDRLVQKNLVTREHSQEDRRLARVELTEEGRASVMQTRSARFGWLGEILDKLDEDRREALVDSLEEFIRAALESTGQFDEACARCGIDHLAFCVVSTSRTAATGSPIEKF
jgi:DNA-binding MarR family transcriptional regulator